METINTYSNPILTGFFPDPSIVKVDEDYYMVNSTFQYFPGIIISHSKDLVNWQQIGHALERNEYLDLTDAENSLGVWAPDISYHDGWFYIFYPFMKKNMETGVFSVKNFMIKSQKPEGPYSEPSLINESGIDPSHFIDDDGSHYMAFDPGFNIIKLNNDCTKAIGDPIEIWKGTQSTIYAEGPHIFKKDGYYHLILAEGGTGLEHRITHARSKNLLGPYESSPYNPVLIQKNPKSRIQKSGHGKLVKTQNNEWWAVYLCGRPNVSEHCTLGRETCLDPVQWTDDGWFVVNEHKGPSEVQKIPNLDKFVFDQQLSDDFDSSTLGKQWQFVRNPDNNNWSLSERAGHLRIWTGDIGIHNIKSKNLLVQRERHHNYSAVVKIEFYPEKNNEQAGIVCYYDTTCFIKLCLFYDNGLKIKLIENRTNKIKQISSIECEQNSIYFKVNVDKQKREFLYSYDNVNWQSAGIVDDCRFLSDEGTFDAPFTGTMIGMYSVNGGSGRRIPADFDFFKYIII